ncbi:MAG: polysaccharide biosynthesis tyrosine autokinase [Gemmatimonadaceae bacterium]
MQLVPDSSKMPSPAMDAGWGNAPTITPEKSALERPLAAIRRYKWLVMSIVALSVAGGVAASRFVKPEYEVRATLWIASQTPQEAGGPIRSRELLNPTAWVDLLRSFRIADAVVRKLALYVKPAKSADAPVFANFSIADKLISGDYTLTVNKAGTRWNLGVESEIIADSGAVGDSIGRAMGLLWQPDARLLKKNAGRDIKFNVRPPREVSQDLNMRLTATLLAKSNFLNLTLTDTDRELAALTLNSLTSEYLTVAGELKKKNVSEFRRILEDQLQYAEGSLKDAETALETFKFNTIALPTEGATPAIGLVDTRPAAMKQFFDQKIEYDNIKHDREQLEKTLAEATAGTLPLQSMLFVPSVAMGPGGLELRGSFTKLDQQQADLAAARQVYTDNYPAVKQLADAVNILRTKTIPAQAQSLITQLKDRESQFDRRISSATQDLQSIPARTIEEMRLRRNVTVAEGLYQTLKANFAQARLAEASATPDVNVLDAATVPATPSKNTKPRVLAMTILGGLALALGLALLLDSMDKRLRYPEQATDLGLTISGTVPELPKLGAHQTPEQISQLVESFRTLRMNVKNSMDGPKVSLAVSSPSPGDGKSFISSNLAMSFADAGFRTLLVDGDTRRGALHEMFGLTRTAGLTDFLVGDVDQRAIVHSTGHDNLFLVPTGTLRRRSPELLTSPAMTRLVADFKAQYDVLIFDTPPLAAGIDGYAIAAATGSLLVVLRIGQTERRMAAQKLLLVDRLPINLIGSVLNAAPAGGEYEYYGYVPGYGTEDLEPGQRVAQITS